QLTDMERRIASQRQLVEQQKKSGSLRNNPTYAILISKRTELQGQRDTLMNRQDLTDKHPRVAAISDQITAIDRQIDELRQQDAGLVSQSPEARELASLESERNRLKLELEVTGRELARRSASQADQPAATAPVPTRRDRNDSTVIQDYLALKRNNNEAATDLQVAEAKTEGSQAFAVRILDDAGLPTQPAGPNRALLISLAAVFGLIVGFLFALIAESGRLKSLQDAYDVERFARLPLLASIPKTVTPRCRKRLLWIAAVKLTAFAALSGAATFALSQFFVASHIFDLVVKK
ncbi:MAG TPA: GNVR domain-containing protein, partial [Blastocatellia bacterium]|nr:GNVR domain-containing protein [Blastocatellia bacterium]